VKTQAELSLAYGAGRLLVAPPAGRFTTLVAVPPPAVADPAASLRAALDAPIEAPPLRELIRPGDRATIVVSDATRVTGARELLPPLLAYLDSAGLSAERVRILFALGIHRPHTPAEQAAVIGGEVAARVAHVDHACDDERELETFTLEGPAASVSLNRQVLDGSLVIVTGTIAFHYLAGFGGGRKAILPGVAARESVREFHSRSLAAEAGAGRHPAIESGARAGNPLDAFATRVAETLPRSFLINTIMAGHSGVASIWAGDLTAAFDRGCEAYCAQFAVPIPERRPVVIVSAGGAPRDCDLVQAQKAIGAGAAALAPGGMLLVLAACGEGAGQGELLRWFAHPDRASHVAALRAAFSVPGQTALALREHAARVRVYLRSELPPDVVARAGMVPVARFEDFSNEVLRRYGPDVEGYVVPEGARYLPVAPAAA
jgi:nickel-dependent lactate racemase